MAPLLLLLLLGAPPATSTARSPPAKASGPPTAEVRVGVLVPERNLSSPWAWPRVSPALNLALEALQSQLSHAGLAVRITFASTEDEHGVCDPLVTLLKAAELKSSHGADVLFGMGCLEGDFELPFYVQSWQVPLLVVTGAYQPDSGSSAVVNAGPFRLLDFFVFQARLLRHFNWTVRAVVVASPWSQYWIGLPVLSYVMQGPGSFSFTVREHKYREPGEAVRFIQAEGRVVFICGSLEMLHQIMHLAHAQNMTNGDYVFLYVDPFGETLRAKGHCEPAKSNKTQDTGNLREAFQTVLVITPHEPQTPQYQYFQSQLILRAQSDFGVILNDSVGHIVAGCFHDGLLLYLRALNETLLEGGTKRDTGRILEKMRSLKLQGVTGMVSISSRNAREMDFDLWSMKDVKSGEYQVVCHYIASEEKINWTGSILWKTGRPPFDNPSCVFEKYGPSCAGIQKESFIGTKVPTTNSLPA